MTHADLPFVGMDLSPAAWKSGSGKSHGRFRIAFTLDSSRREIVARKKDFGSGVP
jgi:hypothetical protein